MKLLSNFLVIVLVIIGVVAVLPLLSFGFALVGGAGLGDLDSPCLDNRNLRQDHRL